jgi:hypothetical protein
MLKLSLPDAGQDHEEESKMRRWIPNLCALSTIALLASGAGAQEKADERKVSVPSIPAHLVCSCECGTETHDLALKENCGDYNNKLCRTGTGVEKRYKDCREIGVKK